ncbi:MAG: 7-cyano-7-deazaguanine synthase QueC [Methylomarinum sp.]|nr:7-cyano-7-deazaguanine synthase QueC [Methylomarinum sp.]
MQKKAIILLSGGLDSITVLAKAKKQGYECYALSFDYGQRHNAELYAAREIAEDYQVVEHKIINLGLGSIGGSALTDDHIAVPNTPQQGIPVTYVPARNTIFLSFALGWAEVLKANDIFIGVNAIDYSGYPDCRPEFIKAFQTLANLATKAGVEGEEIKVHSPLIEMSKAEIIKQGLALGVDYKKTVSCYSADKAGRACGVCEACRLRKTGFTDAGVEDPTCYQ